MLRSTARSKSLHREPAGNRWSIQPARRVSSISTSRSGNPSTCASTALRNSPSLAGCLPSNSIGNGVSRATRRRASTSASRSRVAVQQWQQVTVHRRKDQRLVPQIERRRVACRSCQLRHPPGGLVQSQRRASVLAAPDPAGSAPAPAGSTLRSGCRRDRQCRRLASAPPTPAGVHGVHQTPAATKSTATDR